MTSGITMHYHHAAAAIKARMAYRTDFLLSMFVMMISEAIAPLVVFLMYQNGATFPGWSLYEMILLQSMYLLAIGIAFPFFFGMVWNTIYRIRSGNFDMLLLKPRNALHMTIATGFDSEDLGKLIGGLLFFGIAITNLPAPSIIQVLQFLAMIIVMLSTLFAFALFMSGTAFTLFGGWRLYEIFHSLLNFGLYPKNIYVKPVQTIISFIIPIAAITFLPASILLGKSFDYWWVTVLVSITFLISGLIYWFSMLKKLTSAGG